DLLADSMHYAEVVGKDFERELQTARDYFDEADQTEFPNREIDRFGPEEDNYDQPKESIKEDDEEKGPDHYRWKNDSQLAVALGRIESAMEELDHAIEYRGENSREFFNNGDRAGVGSLLSIKGTLQKVLDRWEKDTEFYGM
ncbi:uncharacterized protein METZ01_LOCUS477203, partial [marine metagenome]